MSVLAKWLGTLPDSNLPSALERAKAFVGWCEEQLRGEDASDDVFTILVVGFFEKLLESDATRRFVPSFLTREDLERDPGYRKTWVGDENYAKALEQFTATT